MKVYFCMRTDYLQPFLISQEKTSCQFLFSGSTYMGRKKDPSSLAFLSSMQLSLFGEATINCSKNRISIHVRKSNSSWDTVMAVALRKQTNAWNVCIPKPARNKRRT